MKPVAATAIPHALRIDRRTVSKHIDRKLLDEFD
jgi:hypothetical protein